MPQREESEEPEEPEEPEEEPLLRYQRLGADVSELLRDDHATCLACHPKFLALGTRAGVVAVFDLTGKDSDNEEQAVGKMARPGADESQGSSSAPGTQAGDDDGLTLLPEATPAGEAP